MRRVKFHFFTCGYPASFVKRLFFHLNCLDIFFENRLIIILRAHSEVSSLSHWSICLFLSQCHTVLIIILQLCFFFWDCCTLLGPLNFHMIFRISLSVSAEKSAGILVSVVLNPKINLRRKLSFLTSTSWHLSIPMQKETKEAYRRRERGVERESETHVNPWLFHSNVWQNSPEIKKKKKKERESEGKRENGHPHGASRNESRCGVVLRGRIWGYWILPYQIHVPFIWFQCIDGRCYGFLLPKIIHSFSLTSLPNT